MDSTRRMLKAVGILLACVFFLGAKPVDRTTSPAKTKSEPVRTVKANTAAASGLAVTPSTKTPLPMPGSISKESLNPGATQQSPAASYDIPWQSINGGGAPSSSTNYSVNASVGQSAIGFATSTNYQAGIGYWYGSNAPTSCDCPYQSDFDANGILDALDLNELIDILFFGGVNPQDPLCPTTRGDFDNSGVPDALDLNDLIDHLFFGGTPPVDPCA